MGWLQDLTLLSLLRLGLRVTWDVWQRRLGGLSLLQPPSNLLPTGPDFADWVCLGIGYVSMLGALAVAVWLGLSWAMLRGGRHRARLGAARGLLTASVELGRELHGKLMRSAGGLPPKLV